MKTTYATAPPMRGAVRCAGQEVLYDMDFWHSVQGWRRIWLVAAFLYPISLVLVVFSVFPSRSDIARDWLNKAIDIERQFDSSASALNHALLRARFSGVPDIIAVGRIREALWEANPNPPVIAEANEPRTRGASTRANLDTPASPSLGRPVPHPAGRLLWFDPARSLTAEALDNLRNDFSRADAIYQRLWLAWPRRMAFVAAAALALGIVTMGLIYFFCALVEWLLPSLMASSARVARRSALARPGGGRGGQPRRGAGG